MKKKIFLIENTKKQTDNLKISGNVSKGDCCPECGESWDGGDIFEFFMSQKTDVNSQGHSYYKYKTDSEIKKDAESYGWSEDSKVRFGKVIGIELPYDDPEHYDGVSYWQCPGCGIAWNRFTGIRSESFAKHVINNLK